MCHLLGFKQSTIYQSQYKISNKIKAKITKENKILIVHITNSPLSNKFYTDHGSKLTQINKCS